MTNHKNFLFQRSAIVTEALSNSFSLRDAATSATVLLAICLSLTVSGCSFSGEGPSDSRVAAAEAVPSGPVGLSLYLARGSLFAAPEFEQYKVIGSSLFVECGIIRSGRPQAQAQNLLKLTPGADDVLHTLGTELTTYLRSDHPSIEPASSGSLGFLHPGDATITLSGSVTRGSTASGEMEGALYEELKTTVDEISSASSSSPLKKLVIGLRTIARESLKAKGGTEEPLCGNVAFYGIE